MADSSVKVAIRVRPFNSREQQEGAELCVEMDGKMTKIFNKQTGQDKEYFFDYSYWSHSGFKEDQDSGILYKDSPSSQYADQQMVFNDLGLGVLENAWEGYHCCLFAYGQTGAGKSYSMVGYGPNKGIIPMVCEEIFNKIRNSDNQNIEFKVCTSMLEIYNEQIQDLLENPNNRVKGGLRVREDPKTGVFVDGLVKEEVNSYDEISAVLDKGNKHRTVAATQMNATSSRAHTVLTISFMQIFYDEATGKQLNRKESNINLVDLAGSERAAKTGASGDRLQEGSNINKSLSTLGKVITALAKKSSGSLGKNEVIPYRESKLTRILQNALGGNSKTTMIAAISPATFNYDETLSTLRYADAVKSIKNQAVVNETPQEKLIRELKEQNEKLKAMLEGRSPSVAGGGGGDGDKNEYQRKIEELKRAKEEAEKTWQQKIEEQKQTRVKVKKAEPVEEKITTPHIRNLNEDPLLSGYIKHKFKEGLNRIGKRNSEDMPEIPIDGLGIGIEHCVVVVEEDVYRLVPSDDPSKKTTVNGKLLTEPHELEHNDRIKFGNHNFFIFKDPDELDNTEYDWEFAVKEATAEQVRGLLGAQDEELKKKQEEMKQKLEEEMEEARKKMEEEKQQLEELLKNKEREDSETQKALAEREKEILDKQRKMEEEMRRKAAELQTHENNRLALERLKKILSNSIQQINEANERAVLLGKNVMFQPEIYRETGRHGIGTGLENTNVRIKVIYPEISEDFQIHWSRDKLDRRLVDMQDICNQISYGTSPTEIEMAYDPFSDNIDQLEDTYQLIGHSYLYMDVIYYLLNIDEDLIPIIDDKGAKKGNLRVALSPGVQVPDVEDLENIREVLGKQLQLTVNIVEAVDIPEKLSTDVYCEYFIVPSVDESFRTEKAEGTSVNPQFHYTKEHSLLITDELVEELLNHALSISVYGDLSREKRAMELNKLKVQVDKERFALSGVSPQMLQSADIEYLDLSNNQEEEESFQINLLGDADDLQYLLEQKELALEQLRHEQQEREAELAERKKLLNEKERMLKAKAPKKKSKMCQIF